MSIGVTTASEGVQCNAFEVYKQADDEMSRYKISQSGSEKSKVIDMLLSALSEKDFVSQGHVERLAELCAQMGDALNLHDVQKRNLVLLSKVHDLGKIGIPDEILNKPGRLTPEEYEKMKQHVKIGYNIASRSKVLVAIALLILHHHEHWSGNGYPDSIAGEKIPLECRILNIIDAFDAMTNDRPYHKGIPVQAALEEIRRCAGDQFDPELATKFVDIVSSLYTVSPAAR
jgi:HD-GYP domain-containing protein (c-di-GMP phosphodiesterase class II)